MNMFLNVLAAFLCGAAPLAAGGQPPTFTRPPAARKAGESVRITFTVSTPTDVEVAILDAGGRVVRHLVAGLLGRNAPAPLKKDSLV